MTIKDYIDRLNHPIRSFSPIPAPDYIDSDGTIDRPNVGFAVESMRNHTTNEGWELFNGLACNGYILAGHNLFFNSCNTQLILDELNPKTVVVQDKREWDVPAHDFRDKKARFENIGLLRNRPDIFKVTVLKDSHQRPDYHKESAEEIGCHAWIIYYDEQIVSHLARYVRPEHLIRTYHSVDPSAIPPFNMQRQDIALLSGAMGDKVYPIRTGLLRTRHHIPSMKYLRHPGYNSTGCYTPNYLTHLNYFKVAICTCSVFGYALRKIIEATACGCIVVTNLPTDETLPLIDGNLVRVYGSDWNHNSINLLVRKLYREYDYNRQICYADQAKEYYHYKQVGLRLALDISHTSMFYNAGQKYWNPKITPPIIFPTGTMIENLKTVEVKIEESTMDERTALSRMVAPGTKRPGKYREGVIQIWITRNCDKSCYGCTQGSNLRTDNNQSGFMTPEQFEQAVLSLKGYWGVVGVFGGNPAVSPHFESICEILVKYVPFQQRGLWCNNPLGKGKIMRRTFDPSVSNLNVHLDVKAYEEFRRDWPESRPFGVTDDCRHSPPYVAMKDVIADESKRWELISNCDINKHWSAMIGVFRGQLRAWFCEIAGAQSILHQHEADYPDTGYCIVDPDGGVAKYGFGRSWWELSMASFSDQVRKHCHECGVPLRGHGELSQAVDGSEQVTKTHESIFNPKKVGRRIELVSTQSQLGKPLENITKYMQNGRIA